MAESPVLDHVAIGVPRIAAVSPFLCGELGAELPWTFRRANLLVDGVALPQDAGAKLTIGNLQLKVTLETAPCELMDAQHDGLTAALTPDWRGGVCCRVLNDAEVRLGDSVTVSPL